VKIRRDDSSKILFAVTLTELLFTILFVTLAAIGVMKTRSNLQMAKVRNDLATCLDTSKQEMRIKELETKILSMEATISSREKQIAMLVNSLRDAKRTLGTRLNLSEAVEEIIKGPGKGAAASGTAGGIGKPICPVFDGFLFDVTMNEDRTFTLKCEWSGKTQASLMEIPAVRKVYVSSQGKRVMFDDFRMMCGQITSYCNDNNCRFRIKAYDNTETKDSYKKLMSFLEGCFYVAKR